MLAPKCATCDRGVVRRPGARGRLPKRCAACREGDELARQQRAAERAAKPKPPLPRRGDVEEALRAELAGMPEQVRTSTEAAAARALAVQVDQGLSMTAATKELTRVMALLRGMATAQRPAPPARPDDVEQGVPRGVADLAARAAERRRSAAG